MDKKRANPNHDLLAALDSLAKSIDANLERSKAIKRRIESLKRHSRAGVSITEIVGNETRPLVVTLVSESIQELQGAGSHLRWAQATALRSDGASIAEIARQFAVSRQRVSALLNDPPQSVAHLAGTASARTK